MMRRTHDELEWLEFDLLQDVIHAVTLRQSSDLPGMQRQLGIGPVYSPIQQMHGTCRSQGRKKQPSAAASL